MKTMCVAGALMLALATPTLAQGSTKPTTAKATFKNAEGKQIGNATLTQTPNGTLIKLDVRGLPPGDHAFHIHEVGKCDGADGFKSAGDHFAGGKKHGFETTGGPHPGDMPNQHVGQDGMLKGDVFNPNVTLGSGDGSVFDQDGSAMVIHAKADDYHSQPSGDAGDRLACAVIEKQ